MSAQCRLLELDDDLSAVARLIYNADPYIYRDLLGKEDRANEILSSLLKKEEGTFSYKYTHILEYNNKIVGTAALYSAMLTLNKDDVRSAVLAVSKEVSNEFDTVTRHLSFKRKDVVVRLKISRFCIDTQYRNRGFGSKLMGHLCDAAGCNDIELTVLEENELAIKLYKKFGFKIESSVYGYGKNPDSSNVVCFNMIRNV